MNAQSKPEELLNRMRAGDREAAAEFVTRYGTRVRLRVRDKLGPAMRRVYDSQDVLSTLSRRLDALVCEGRIRATSEAQLWSLAMAIATNAISENIRALQRRRRAEGPDGDFARALLARIPDDDDMDSEMLRRERIEQILTALDNETDRCIVWMWLADVPRAAIAEELNMKPEAVRMRWSRLRERLRNELECEE